MEEVVLDKVEIALSSPIETLIYDFFESGDIQEAISQLKELITPEQHPQFVKKCLILAGERHAYERELISQLLSACYSTVIEPEKIEEGFQLTLDILEDMILDTPNAPEIIGKFLARAIVDEIVPPIFLKNVFAQSDLSKEAVSLANALTTEKHRINRLAHIWGPGDLCSVKRLKEEVGLLLEEYLINEDLNEADESLRKLNAPSFHFFLVRHAIRLALQKNENEQNKLAKLLSFFSKTGLISSESMTKGFKISYSNLKDLSLDVPNAKTLLEDFTQNAIKEGWLNM